MTREQWLELAITHLERLFKQQEYQIPKLRVSIGFPGGGSAHKRIGEYWPPDAASDKVPQIFISPTHKKDIETLGTLTHELVHAAVGAKAGHGKLFKRCALKIGLTGKMRATTSGPMLVEYCEKIITDIGPLPTGSINFNKRKKQGTRLGKVICATCGYTCRVTKKWTEVGLPICPCNKEPMCEE